MTSGLAAVTAVTVCVLVLCARAEGLTCAGCAGACPPAPQGCPLAREPCGCCDVCALGMGQRCHGMSPGCGPKLMCLTPVGPFPSRPPPESNIRGRCVLSSIPNFAPSTHPTPPILIPTIAPAIPFPTPTPPPTTPTTTLGGPLPPSSIDPKMVGR